MSMKQKFGRNLSVFIKKMMRKCLFLLYLFLLIGTTANAAPYNFRGYWVDVDAWTGTGSNESILVIDYNLLDNPDPTTLHDGHESYAFGYRWDGTKHESDMLNDFNSAGIFTVTTGYGGDFLLNIVYDDGSWAHHHVEEGSWNLASTSDPHAQWGTSGGSEWDFNTAGLTHELLADGQYEGINAIKWFGSYPDYGDPDPGLNIPAAAPVPIPGAVWLLGSGLLGLVGMRRRNGR